MAKITTNLFGELAFLQYQPEAPVSETLEFYTDVMQSVNSTEERLQLRSKPRQSFDYKIPLQSWRIANAFNTEYGALRKKWAVPVWTEAQYIGSIAAHETNILCNTSIYDLRANSLALLYSSELSWQVVEISAINVDSIDITTDVDLINGAWLIPIRLGWVSGGIDKKINGHNGSTSVSFEIDDNLDLTASTPEQYLGNDIYYSPGLLNEGSLQRSLQQRVDIVDFTLGPVVRRSPWTNARYASPYSSLINGASEMRAYKDFVYRRAGKFRAFWMPTFEHNLRLANTGNIASVITVEKDSITDYSLRTNIAFQSTAGVWYPRVISSPIQLINNRVQFTLSSALNVNAANIARVCFLGLNRFDTDRIEINWIGNNVAKSEVLITEITP